MNKRVIVRVISFLFLIVMIVPIVSCKKEKAKVKVVTDFEKITPTITAEDYMKSINNNTEYEAATPKKVKSVIHTPTSDYQYSHHAQINYFKGKFYAFFSSGPVNEEDPGQRVMISTSKDGLEWTEPKPFADPLDKDKTDGIVHTYITGTTYVDKEKGTLTVMYSDNVWLAQYLDEKGGRGTQGKQRFVALKQKVTSDGVNWKEETCFVSPAVTKLSNGRLFTSGGNTHNYSDDFGENWQISHVDYFNKENAEGFTEPSYTISDDGTINMYYRTNSGWIYGTRSYDFGETWTPVYKTNFTLEASMFKFGKLSNGKDYWVGNPVPKSNRTPLTLCISEDGINYNKWYTIEDAYVSRIYYDGRYKSGDYAYPTVLEKDGYLYVIYSSTKETIAVTRIDLSSLDDVKWVKKTADNEIFNTNLINWQSSKGNWKREKGLGYTFYPAVKNGMTVSGTKIEEGQSFTYQADVMYLGDPLEPSGIFSLVFGCSAKSYSDDGQQTTDFNKENYYYLSLDLTNSFSRIFQTNKGEFIRRGCVVPFSEDLKNIQDYHVKIEFDGKEKMASYYINNNFINKVYLEEFTSGYFGLLGYNEGFVFNNVLVEIK